MLNITELKAMVTFSLNLLLWITLKQNAQEDCLLAIQDMAYVNQELILPCGKISRSNRQSLINILNLIWYVWYIKLAFE